MIPEITLVLFVLPVEGSGMEMKMKRKNNKKYHIREPASHNILEKIRSTVH